MRLQGPCVTVAACVIGGVTPCAHTGVELGWLRCPTALSLASQETSTGKRMAPALNGVSRAEQQGAARRHRLGRADADRGWVFAH